MLTVDLGMKLLTQAMEMIARERRGNIKKSRLLKTSRCREDSRCVGASRVLERHICPPSVDVEVSWCGGRGWRLVG